MPDNIHNEIIALHGAGFTANDIQGVLYMKHSMEINEQDVQNVLKDYPTEYDDYDHEAV